MGDARSQPPYGSQSVTPADFAFQPAKLCAVFKCINVPDGSLLWNNKRGDVYIESFLSTRRREAANFTLNGE